MRAVRNKLGDVRWQACKNNNAAPIPSFSLVRVVSVANGIYTVDQPNADSQDVMVTGPVPIPVGQYGVCTNDWPFYAAYNAADGAPAVGQIWGAANGSWQLRKNNSQTGFLIQGDAASGRVEVIKQPTGSLIIDVSSAGLIVNPATKLTLDTNDFVGTNPNTGEFYVKTKGYTGTFSATWVATTTCTSGTLSVTSKTFTEVYQDGLTTVAPTFA